MRTSVLAFACLSLIIFHVVAAGETDQLPLPNPKVFTYGQTPDANVRNWIRLVVIGARNRPFPVIFFSPQRFKTPGFPEVHIVLRYGEYRRLTAFTRTKRCSIGAIERPAWGTLLVTEYRNAHASDLCVLPPDAACDYLSEISMLSGITWTANQLNPIHELADLITCREREDINRTLHQNADSH